MPLAAVYVWIVMYVFNGGRGPLKGSLRKEVKCTEVTYMYFQLNLTFVNVSACVSANFKLPVAKSSGGSRISQTMEECP